MFVSLDRFVTIKATEEEYENLMQILKERRDKGLEAYRWIGNGATVLFEMSKKTEDQGNDTRGGFVVYRHKDEAEPR